MVSSVGGFWAGLLMKIGSWSRLGIYLIALMLC